MYLLVPATEVGRGAVCEMKKTIFTFFSFVCFCCVVLGPLTFFWLFYTGEWVVRLFGKDGWNG
jgi:hypothetical protein